MPSLQQTRSAVVGHGGLYKTTACFESEMDEREFVQGERSCPIGYNCKHVAAIVLAAIEQRGRQPAPATVARRPAGQRTEATPPPAPRPPASDQTLHALVAARRTSALGNPLAIELRLIAPRYPDHGTPRLMARLMRPGARGGWVNGSLDWGGLDAWRVIAGGYPDDHVKLIRQLHAVYRLREAQSTYMYGYRTERTIDLSACGSPQLWPLLDEVARLGLPLIHTRSAFGEVPHYVEAGGVRLNLTEADYCFLLDPWWNPATEAQAIDRTHRIGQTRHVMDRLIAHNTIEEKVRALARRKAELFQGVVDDGDLFAGAITAEDIRGLLGLTRRVQWRPSQWCQSRPSLLHGS